MKRHGMILLCLGILSVAILTYSGRVTAWATVMDVTLLSGKVSVSAQDAPLEDLLQALGEKAGVTLKTSPAALEEPVTFDFAGITVAEAIKRLLVDWNYALFFRKPAAGQAGEYLLWIYEKKRGEQKKPAVIAQPVLQAPGYSPPPPITMSSAEYEKLFADTREVERQLFAEPPVDSPPEFAGILVFDVKPNSAAANLGIAEGDLITDVNGTPIRTLEDFAKMLHPQALGERSAVMIKLIRKDRTTGSINIRLQE